MRRGPEGFAGKESCGAQEGAQELQVGNLFRSIEVVTEGAPVSVLVQIPKFVPGPTNNGNAFAGANWPITTDAPIDTWLLNM